LAIGILVIGIYLEIRNWDLGFFYLYMSIRHFTCRITFRFGARFKIISPNHSDDFLHH